jgi:hypothetical protein
MAATTTTITFDFTKTNPLKRWQFNSNGATSYLFSDSTITGPTSQTVAEGSLFKVSRSDDQYDGLTEGNGASIFLDASMNELLGISSTNTFVKRLIIVPFFRTFNNYWNMNQENNIFSGEAGRWITRKTVESEMFKSKIRFINRSDDYYMESWPAGGFNISGTNWGNFTKDISFFTYGSEFNSKNLIGDANDTSSVFRNDATKTYNHTKDGSIFNTAYIGSSGTNATTASAVGNLYNSQYKYLDFSPGNGTEGLVSGSNDFGVYYDFPLLTSDKVRFEIPFALTIPQFQHVWTDWPWNKGRKTLTTDLVFTKIEFRVMYDTISEYKAKFYAPVDPIVAAASAPGAVWLDPEKTRLVPTGYLARNGKYAIINESGVAIFGGLRNCQSKITVTTSANGSVSSTYPSTVSGYGDYDFNPDVSYITLDAAPNYPIVFDRWEATDFDGNVTTISYESTISVYHGLYQSIKPIFTATTPSPTPGPDTPSPTPAPTPAPSSEYDYYTADVFACGDCSASTETIVVAFAAGTPVTPGRFYLSADGPDGNSYRIDSSTAAPGTAYLLTNAFGSFTSCSLACSA